MEKRVQMYFVYFMLYKNQLQKAFIYVEDVSVSRNVLT